MANKGYILMLESDEQDKELSKNYFNALGIPYEFLKFSHELIPFLQNKQALPAVILLSMNSVPNNGLQTLKELKSIANLKHIPVTILGESTGSDLIKLCYANGASSFINKPLKDAITDSAIKNFVDYWFNVVELPETNEAHRHYN